MSPLKANETAKLAGISLGVVHRFSWWQENRLGLKRPLWVANGLGAQLEDGRWSFPLPARAVGSGFLSAGLPRDGEAELAVVCTVLSQVFE